MNPYEVLGLHKDVSSQEIKTKYRELSMVHHPDKGGDASIFAKIAVAYKILSNPEKKAQFDKDGFIEPDEIFLKEQMRARVIRIVEDWVTQTVQGKCNITLVRFFNVQIKGGREQLNASKDHLKQVRKLIKTTLKKLSYNNTNQSIAHTIIKQKLHLLKADINNTENEIKVIELVAEELRKYIYKEDSSITLGGIDVSSHRVFTFDFNGA